MNVLELSISKIRDEARDEDLRDAEGVELL